MFPEVAPACDVSGREVEPGAVEDEQVDDGVEVGGDLAAGGVPAAGPDDAVVDDGPVVGDVVDDGVSGTFGFGSVESALVELVGDVGDALDEERMHRAVPAGKVTADEIAMAAKTPPSTIPARIAICNTNRDTVVHAVVHEVADEALEVLASDDGRGQWACGDGSRGDFGDLGERARLVLEDLLVEEAGSETSPSAQQSVIILLPSKATWRTIGKSSWAAVLVNADEGVLAPQTSAFVGERVAGGGVEDDGAVFLAGGASKRLAEAVLPGKARFGTEGKVLANSVRGSQKSCR